MIHQCNKTHHKAIKIKPVQLGMCIEYGVEHNNKGPKFKVGDHVKISGLTIFFATEYASNCFKEVKKIKKCTMDIDY